MFRSSGSPHNTTKLSHRLNFSQLFLEADKKSIIFETADFNHLKQVFSYPIKKHD